MAYNTEYTPPPKSFSPVYYQIKHINTQWASTLMFGQWYYVNCLIARALYISTSLRKLTAIRYQTIYLKVIFL